MFGNSASPDPGLEFRTCCGCRNAYNDLYHWTARYSFLEKLISEGREHYNVVYIDPDILIMQDLHAVFERDFDYLMTISENEEQPINGAMHFVPKGKYHEVSFKTRSLKIRCCGEASGLEPSSLTVVPV